MRAESVFNFYQPDFTPNFKANDEPLEKFNYLVTNPVESGSSAGVAANQQMTTVAPESQIMVDPLIIKQLSLIFKQTMSNKASFNLDLSAPLALADNSVDMLDYLDQLLLAGKMTPAFKAQLQSHLLNVKGQKKQLKEAIYLIVSSADYAVQP